MTASLRHAQPVLSAAINAGFRESGVQSLKNLNDISSFPMVAIRSSGLAFASLVGFINEGSGAVQSLVNEGYLKIILNIANERFEANADRIQRFKSNLLQKTEVEKPVWETKNVRRERKKAQGLEQQARHHEGNNKNKNTTLAEFGENTAREIFISGHNLGP